MKNRMKIMIYGAQGMALTAYRGIMELHPDTDISCFCVSERGMNGEKLAGIPVCVLGELAQELSKEDKSRIQVLIATPETVMEEIERKLDAVGMCNHVRLDSFRMNELQKMMFIKKGMFIPLETYPIGFHMPTLQIYKMVHHRDKKLQTFIEEKEEVTPLQVGAALTKERIADLTDNCGDSISEKNGNYSELTGLYWIWKNGLKQQKDYVGLFHYRRRFELSEDDKYRLSDNDIDVVLPYPLPYEPNMEAHHRRYLSEQEWMAVLQAMEELHPDYAEKCGEVLKQEYLYNYNMILAKREVLDEYCKWLFPILFRIEEIIDAEGTRTPNRYMGYISETLETLYFMSNRGRLKIAHKGCRFLK